MRSWLSRFLLVFAYIVLAGNSPAEFSRISDQPLPTEFSVEKWRAIYLDLAHQPVFPEVEILNPPLAGTREAALLNFYRLHIEPEERMLAQINRQSDGYTLLIDSGLYDNDEEKEAWSNRKEKIQEILSNHSVDEQWKQRVLEFGRLAKDLKGTLPALANNMAIDIELSSYPAELKAEVNELAVLDQKIYETASELPAKDVATALLPKINEIKQRYFMGETPFAQAALELEETMAKGESAYGKSLIDTVGDKIQRTAVIRSRLAKSKGYKTWAELQIARQARGHSEGFRTSADLLNFLYALLDETAEPAQRLYRMAAKSVGRSLESMRPAEMKLALRQPEYLLHGYFQKEKMESTWRENVRASGYNEDVIRRIMIDPFPRPNKQSHAYMWPVRNAAVLKQQIDGRTLDFIVPPADSDLWEKPIATIVENVSDDSLYDLQTVDHEGDHGLDFAHRRYEVSDNESYPQAETFSTAREDLSSDPDYIRTYAINRKGERPSEETIQKYVQQKKLLDLHSFRLGVMDAIIDLELWDFDYSKPGAAKLWERLMAVYKKAKLRTTFVPAKKDLIAAAGYSYFSVDFNYSGIVIYYGYTMARVSATMLNNYLMNEFEKINGRRSLFHQPDTARLMAPIYYHAPKMLYPESIEVLTGLRYSAPEFARGLKKEAHEIMDLMECDRALGETP